MYRHYNDIHILFNENSIHAVQIFNDAWAEGWPNNYYLKIIWFPKNEIENGWIFFLSFRSAMLVINNCNYVLFSSKKEIAFCHC